MNPCCPLYHPTGPFYHPSGLFYHSSGSFYHPSGPFYHPSGPFYHPSGPFYHPGWPFYRPHWLIYHCGPIYHSGSNFFILVSSSKINSNYHFIFFWSQLTALATRLIYWKSRLIILAYFFIISTADFITPADHFIFLIYSCIHNSLSVRITAFFNNADGPTTVYTYPLYKVHTVYPIAMSV